MTQLKATDFKAQAQVFKALAHPGRLLMVNELSKGERYGKFVFDNNSFIGEY